LIKENNQSEGGYTLTRDNQAKRVGKLACQRASADCSASVPSKTEHSTKCRRANGGRAKSMPYRRFATDSILTYGEITYQACGLDKKIDKSKLAEFFCVKATKKMFFFFSNTFFAKSYNTYKSRKNRDAFV
jgi:hypothetical protein